MHDQTVENSAGRSEPTFTNRQFARSVCAVDDVRKAVEAGLSPNSQWQQLDMEDPKPTSGCLIIISPSPGRPCWANWNTPIHKALSEGHYDAAALLLEHGAQINLLNALGRTAMHEAAARSSHRAAEFLAHHHANVNAITEARSFRDEDWDREEIFGKVPLHEAITNNDIKMIDILIQAGANTQYKSPEGWTMLDLALLERNKALIEALVQHGGCFSDPDSAGISTQRHNFKEMARLLLRSKDFFPPAECFPVYLHLVKEAGMVESLQSSVEIVNTKSETLIAKFFGALSATAERANPEAINDRFSCHHCIRAQRLLSPHESNVLLHHQDRKSLRTSANNGCNLCGLLEDALKNKNGPEAYIDRNYKHEGSQTVAVTARIVLGTVIVSAFCGDDAVALNVKNNLDTFAIDHQQNPDSAVLGTASPRAFALARAWIQSCKTTHQVCNEKMNPGTITPRRLIDVGDDSTEPFLCANYKASSSYCILSYPRQFLSSQVTTRANLVARMRAIPLKSLSPIFHDAIIASRRLGLRYVWIDVLCTAQDDEDEKSEEIERINHTSQNAELTISVQDRKDGRGGLFRPREDVITSPVPFSIRVPRKNRKHGLSRDTEIPFLLPVQAEKAILEEREMNLDPWMMLEQALSRRILHYGPGLLFWECLECHGSESDPEGQAHPKRSSCTNFDDIRNYKRVLQGHGTQYSDFNTLNFEKIPEDKTKKDEMQSADEEDDTEQIEEEEKDTDDKDGEDETKDDTEALAREEEQGAKAEGEKVNNKSKADLYRAWRLFIPAYTSRLSNGPQNPMLCILGLSNHMEHTLQDKSIAGIFTGAHLLPSLLWSTRKGSLFGVTAGAGADARNPNYPSWSWASVQGQVGHHDISQATCVPTECKMEIQTVDRLQSRVAGGIHVISTVRKFPKSFKFWRYQNHTMRPFESHLPRRGREHMKKEWSKGLKGELMVVQGYRDVKGDGKQNIGSDFYFVVMARFAHKPQPRYGKPTFVGGRPKSMICLVVVPVGDGEDAPERSFRRVGLCELWDNPHFWKTAKKDEHIYIV
ncbi:MAG: hypothetical protein M1820_000919 [Bogoriella megaspora]|nr:MAG: hypothetical protein M1820_000919 [Bogoriella megaspora]